VAVSARFVADFSDFYSAVQKAEVSLRSFETGAGKVETSLTRMANSLSGTTTIQQATLMTEAVARVGGATTLTAAEQSRVNRTVTEAIAKYTALGQTAPKSMMELQAATNKVAASGTKATSTLTTMGVAIGSFIGTTATIAMYSLVSALKGFIAEGAKLPGIERSFQSLAVGVNVSADEMLAAMRRASLGMVQDADLMLSANKAILLGLPVTAQEMGKLAETATMLGRAMGMDATTALDDLIKALGRSSPMILDNLGLTVKVGEANEAYAETLGKTSAALTDAEKKTAFYVMALEKADEKIRDLGDQQLTFADMASQAWTTVANAVVKTSSVMNIALGKYISYMKEVSLGNQVAKHLEFLDVTLPKVAGAVGTVGETYKVADLQAKAFTLSESELAGVMNQLSTPAVVTQTAAVYQLATAMKGLSNDFVNAGTAVEVNLAPMAQVAEDTTFFAEQAKWAAEQEAFLAEQAKGLTPEVAAADGAVKEAGGTLQLYGQTANTVTGTVGILGQAFSSTGQTIHATTEEVRAGLRAMYDAYEAAGIFVHGAWDQFAPPGGFPAGGSIPGFANGVSNFSGGPAIVGERGPELVNLPRGSSVTPNSALGGVSVSVSVDARGSFFDTPTGQARFARMISDAIDKKLRSGGIAVGRA
jgi:hypothetical protein